MSCPSSRMRSASNPKKVMSVANTKKAGAQEVQTERRQGDRRKKNVAVAVERRKKPRRRQIDPTTCERDYSNEEIEFMHALDDYKRRSGRMFPTCSEILEVIRDLGYARASAEDASQTDTVALEDLPQADDSSANVLDDDDASVI